KASGFTVYRGCATIEEEEATGSDEDLGLSRGSGVCKWFSVRICFGFLSMTNRDGKLLRSLKEGEAVEFTFKKSSKGPESVTKTPKGQQKQRSNGDRCYNCGRPDHHAKECQLPRQPKKCHFCQGISHIVANCPVIAQQSSPGSQGIASSLREEKEEQSHDISPKSTIFVPMCSCKP
uniref:Protein lin-28 homolog A n=1 Tax=Oncorhynchus tshawytscha TaxID=74940 RepID=A0AAZ3RMZ1_ONCTS